MIILIIYLLIGLCFTIGMSIADYNDRRDFSVTMTLLGICVWWAFIIVAIYLWVKDPRRIIK